MLRNIAIMSGLVAAFAAGMAFEGKRVEAQAKNRIFEIRTYTAGDGKMPAVVKRFRDPEAKLFDKYKMPAILYSTAADPPLSQFIYVLAHESRESARKSWEGFLADPDFKAAAAASDVGGKAVIKVESIFVSPTDFSPLK